MAIRKHSALVSSLRGPTASSSLVLGTISEYVTVIERLLPAHCWMCVVIQWTLAVYLPVMPIDYAWSVSIQSSSSRSHRRQRYYIKSTGDTGPRCRDTF
jgi:hypothetical protein